MKHRIIRRVAVEWDLVEYADQIALRSTRGALRFLDEMEAAFERLARMPRMGSPCEFRNPEAGELRFWVPSRMRNFVILYRPLKDGIEVIRIIRGARNWQTLFDR